jgi:CHASE3 domain sensor protein
MKLQLGSRMRAGFFAMAALLVVAGLVTILYTYRLQRVATRLLEDNVRSTKTAQQLQVALFQMRGIAGNYFLDSEPHWLADMEEREIDFRTSLARAREQSRTTEESELLGAIAEDFDEYEEDLEKVLGLNRRGDVDGAKRLLATATTAAFESTYRRCESFAALNESFMVAATQRIGRTNRALRAAMYGLGVAGLAMGYLLGLMLTRSITKPIYELVLRFVAPPAATSSNASTSPPAASWSSSTGTCGL